MSFYKSEINLEIVPKINDFEYGLSKPQRNQEPYMRIFVRDPLKRNEAYDAFKAFCLQFENPNFVSGKMKKHDKLEEHPLD